MYRPEELVGRSVFVLRETQAQFKNPAVLWSTGKDSTTVLSLIREAFMGAIPWPVIHLDTDYKFPEIYEFRDKIAAEWGFELIVAKNVKALKNGMSPNTFKRLECCTALKTDALKELIHKRRFDAIVVSIRRDEHGIRGKERYMSPRDKEFRWNVWTTKGSEIGTALQDTELSGWNLYESYFGEEIDHVRVHPILHWTELDVWKYIRDRSLPFNPLYRESYVRKIYGWKDKRFRSLGCTPCTHPVDSNASTIEAIINDLSCTIGEERAGRAQDKEEANAMERLRALGYM